MIDAISLGAGGAGLGLVPTWTTCATGAESSSVATMMRSASTPFTDRTVKVTFDSPGLPATATCCQPTYWSASAIVWTGAFTLMVSVTVESVTRRMPTIAPGTIGPSAATSSRSAGPSVTPARARKSLTVPGWARRAMGLPLSTTVTGKPRSRTTRRPGTRPWSVETESRSPGPTSMPAERSRPPTVSPCRASATEMPSMTRVTPVDGSTAESGRNRASPDTRSRPATAACWSPCVAGATTAQVPAMTTKATRPRHAFRRTPWIQTARTMTASSLPSHPIARGHGEAKVYERGTPKGYHGSRWEL